MVTDVAKTIQVDKAYLPELVVFINHMNILVTALWIA